MNMNMDLVFSFFDSLNAFKLLYYERAVRCMYYANDTDYKVSFNKNYTYLEI